MKKNPPLKKKVRRKPREDQDPLLKKPKNLQEVVDLDRQVRKRTQKKRRKKKQKKLALNPLKEAVLSPLSATILHMSRWLSNVLVTLKIAPDLPYKRFLNIWGKSLKIYQTKQLSDATPKQR